MKTLLLLLFAIFLFLPIEVSAQVVGIINNENAAITVTDAAAVDARTFENRLYNTNHGEINLVEDYIITGTGATNGNGHFNLGGDWNNSGTFFPDFSTVQFYGNSLQNIIHTGEEFFYNLIIDNSGAAPLNRIVLSDNVTITNNLTLTRGNVEPGAANRLYLSNQARTSLNYLSTTGSRVMGKFRRGVGETGNYLFPLGSVLSPSYYNPLNFEPNVAPASGSLLAEFIKSDPGNQGLPVLDPTDSVDVYEQYPDGYWSLIPFDNFNSSNYNLNIDGTGFAEPIHDIASVMKRNEGEAWDTLDGTHIDANNSVGYRANLEDGFNGNGNHYAFGHTRPRIVEQPMDTSVCDGTEAIFEVRARWRKWVTYQWQENTGTGWNNLSDGGIYSGAETSTLHIDPADLSMDGNQYRVIVTHKHNHYNISDPATLTVNPIPEAVATPDRQIICNEGTTNIALTERNLIPVDSFRLEILYSGNITGMTTILNGSTSIIQTLTNPGTDVDSVIYRIIPYGKQYTYCEGIATTAVVLVNPTPTLFASVPDTLYCNPDTAFFSISNTQLTTGMVKYDLRVSGHTGDFNGESADADGLDPAVPDPDFYDALSHGHPEIRQLDYLFIPYIEDSDIYGGPECYNDFDTTVIVRMVPELTGLAVADTYIGGDNIRCHGLSDGKIGLTPTGGDYRYEYQFVWEDAAGDTLQNNWNAPLDSLSNQPVGTYSYSITDTIGCNVLGAFVLTEPDTLNVNQTLNSPLCVGAEDGSILRIIEGGHAGYKGFWQNLNTEESDSTINTYDAEKGFYYFSVTDTNQCFYEEETTFLPSPVAVTSGVSDRSSSLYDATYDIRCYGELGWIEVEGTSGQAPFSYEWFAEGDLETSISTSSLLTDTAGIYYCKVTDDNGCIEEGYDLAINAREITQPDSIQIEKINPQYPGDWDIKCFGESNGALELNYTGGHIHQYKNDFQWTGPSIDAANQNDSTVNTLVPGIYSVDITDEFGCTANFTDTLEQPPHIGFTITDSTYIGGFNVSCFGLEDGKIVFDTIYGGGINGDTAIYYYDWSVITDPPGYILTDTTTKDQINVPAGVYSLLIKDNIGCERDTSFSLSQPEPLISNSIVDTIGTLPNEPKNNWEIRCFGFNDGMISLSPEGGSENYTYAWVGAGVTDGQRDQQDLYEGEYIVTILDENGCEYIDSFELESPDTLILNPTIGFVECFGETDTIFLSPSGGFGEYHYLWESGGSSDSLLADIPAGTYYVEVRDDNECITSDSLKVLENGEIVSEVVVTSDYGGSAIKCFDESNGAMRINIVSGGESPFNYQWIGPEGILNGETAADISGIPAANYLVEITDNFNCKDTATLELTQPDPLVFNQIQLSDPNCAGWNDGEIELYLLGGTLTAEDPAYDISINNEALIGSLIAESLFEGTYTIRVNDFNNCTIDSTVVLVDPEPLFIEFDTISAECIDSDDGAIIITNWGGGVNPFLPEIEGYGSGDNFTRLISGEYLIHLADNTEGCYLDTTAIVGYERLSCLEPPTAFTPNGDGFNDTWILDEDEDGSTDMIYYPEAELRIYNRWGELIYYTNNVANEPWDGTYKGREMPVDSYFYVLDLNNGEAPKRGHVTIIR